MPTELPISYETAKRFLQLDHDDFKQEILDAIAEIVDELELTTSSVIDPATVRPVVRRAIKEMLAHKLRFKGDEAAEYPASIQRVIRQITAIRI